MPVELQAEPETRIFRRHPRLLNHVRRERSQLPLAARIRSAVAWVGPDGCDP
ncbi:MAG: hypothetical protein OXC09_00385 [Truepera sp.]|nr:hypothetical protein [Truepera sp.]